MLKQLPRNWVAIRREWPVLTVHQRFETSVAFLLTLVIDVVILVALYRLIVGVVGTLMLGTLNPLEHAVFQRVFGEIMTLLIALEFNHTLQFVVARQQSIIQTKIVLLISILALARKVIVLDLERSSPGELLGLAALTFALGAVYWMMRERDDRIAGVPKMPAN